MLHYCIYSLRMNCIRSFRVQYERGRLEKTLVRGTRKGQFFRGTARVPRILRRSHQCLASSFCYSERRINDAKTITLKRSNRTMENNKDRATNIDPPNVNNQMLRRVVPQCTYAR